MKISKTNLVDYIFENTPIEIITKIENSDKNYFSITGKCGGKYLHYKIKKDDGVISYEGGGE